MNLVSWMFKTVFHLLFSFHSLTQGAGNELCGSGVAAKVDAETWEGYDSSQENDQEVVP